MSFSSEKTFIIGGRHPVQESINNKNRVVKKIILQNEEKKSGLILSKNEQKKITIQGQKFFNKIFGTEFNHQGFAAEIEVLKYPDLNTFLETNNKTNLLFLIIDRIFDDRNLGSIIRSAVAFYVDGIILNQRSFRPTSPHLYKNASGAMEHIPIFAVSNIVNAINILKKQKFWVYGLDQESSSSIIDEVFLERSAFILGSEDSGIKKKILDNSDKILNIPINPKIESLNVSNAAAATLTIYNFSRILKNPPK
jgi:23S rRNA (guanosine2251-2'-O)-methyltransferase